jgi:hypothetical protein
MKAKVGPKELHGGALGKKLGGRSGYEQLLFIQRVHDAIGVERVDLHAEARVTELRPGHDGLNPLIQRYILLSECGRRGDATGCGEG